LVGHFARKAKSGSFLDYFKARIPLASGTVGS
jgi:hypothetical protein